ncbi:MAG: hypothetical protein AB4426_27815 [Xenococcaceae cyanobacterium]
MFIPLLISLAIAAVAVHISFQVTEEIKSVTAILIASIGLFFSLVFSPMLIKLLIVVVLLVSKKSISSISVK